MKNAHLRLGRLEYRRSTERTQTRVSAVVDHYIGEGSQAHLVSMFGHDAEVGAITAAIQENHRFDVLFPDGSRKTVGLGPNASCYKGSLSSPGQKRPLRHLVAASSLLHGNGTAGRTIILNDQPHTQSMIWATLVSLLGLPSDPRWGEYILAQLRRDERFVALDGIGCAPIVIRATREEMLERVGRARAANAVTFPETNGPVAWPRFTIQRVLEELAA
jgi:hypothetical protein